MFKPGKGGGPEGTNRVEDVTQPDVITSLLKPSTKVQITKVSNPDGIQPP